MTKTMKTNITVRDLADVKIARAVIDKAGYDLYEQAVEEHGAAQVNLNLYRMAMELKHPGITLEEVEDSLAKATPAEVNELVSFANGTTYNNLVVLSMPGTNGKEVFMAALTKDEAVKTDSAENVLAKVAEFGDNAIGDKNTPILDLPVVVLKQEGEALRPVQIQADIGALVKDIAKKQK